MAVKSKLIRIFNYIFACIFYYLLILAIGNMNLQSPLGALLAIPYFYFLYYIVKKEKVYAINVKRSWYILQGISCIVMLFMVFQLRVTMSWDWGRLIITAYNYTMTGEIDHSEYFIRYVNNQFWLVVLISLFKIVSKCTLSMDFTVYKAASMLVSIFFTQVTICFVYKSAKLLWSERKAFLVGIAALLYAPFYLYAMFLYTDVPGGFFGVALIYCSIKFYKTEGIKQLFYISMVGILGALVLHTKIITFIIFIAIVIVGIMQAKDKVSIWGVGIMLLCFLICYLLLGTLVNNVLDFNEDEANRYEFPPTHYLMMGLNNYGGWSQDDVDYTWSYDTYEDKITANIEKIKERLNNYGFIGIVKHIFYTKQIRTWTNSCLAGDDYVSRSPVLEDSLCQKIFSQHGAWHWICLIYTWLVHITILIGMLLSAALSIKKEMAEQKLLVGRIAVFGLFFFLSIWECNSRYLLTLTPVMILTAADGIFMAVDQIVNLNGKKLILIL